MRPQVTSPTGFTRVVGEWKWLWSDTLSCKGVRAPFNQQLSFHHRGWAVTSTLERSHVAGTLNPQQRGTGGQEAGGVGEDGTSTRRRVGRLPDQGDNCETSARARVNLSPLYLPLPNASHFTARKVSQEASRYRRQLGGRPRALHPSWTLMTRGPCLWVLLLFSLPPAPDPVCVPGLTQPSGCCLSGCEYTWVHALDLEPSPTSAWPEAAWHREEASRLPVGRTGQGHAGHETSQLQAPGWCVT